jgi:hypothetical protein
MGISLTELPRQGYSIYVAASIGLQHTAVCRSSKGNPLSPEITPSISLFLAEQVSKGYMVGPLHPEHGQNVITSQVAVVPKNPPGKFRVIVDLSSPPGCSVHDAIHCEFTHIAYVSIDDVTLLMYSLGKHCLMAKIDNGPSSLGGLEVSGCLLER